MLGAAGHDAGRDKRLWEGGEMRAGVGLRVNEPPVPQIPALRSSTVRRILLVMDKSQVFAYLAGVLDSDGSIIIAVDTWRVRTLNRSPHYSENIGIGQCDPQAIQLFQEMFGGHIRVEEKRGENRRPMYHWGTTDRNAVVVVNELLPFLRIKRKQAELLLALRQIKERGREANTYLEQEPRIRQTRWGPRPYRRRFLKPSVLKEYDGLVKRIRALNDSRYAFADGRSVPKI